MVEDSGRSLRDGLPPASRAEPVVSGKAGIPNAEWVILTDENIAIRFERHEYYTDFRMFDCVLTTNWINGVKQPEQWELYDGSESWVLADWEDAFWEIRGSVKWDGCVNWETNSECMMHGCGPHHVEYLAAIFNAVYAYTARCPNTCDKADLPQMPEPFIVLPDASAIPTGTAETVKQGSVHG